MILRLLFITYVWYVSPALCRMSTQEFEDKIESICFKGKEDLILGQENPLANTLENFIYLAEKFEVANPNVDFKDELYYFLRNYVFENIILSKSGISQWKPPSADMYEVEKLWEPDTSNLDRMSFEDPFSEDEKCSLYFMLSHSIVDKPGDMPVFRTAPLNRSSHYEPRVVVKDEFYPQEIGVVAVHGTDAAVSLSRVLYGMYVGLRPDREQELSSFNGVKRRLGPNIVQDIKIDKLYAVTLAEVLALSSWHLSNWKDFAPNGKWKSISLDHNTDIKDFCPLVYTHSQNPKPEFALSIFSYSSVRGAADGLILGSVIQDVIQKGRKVKLSQILRMYYSTDGVPVEHGSIEMNPVERVSFCNRFDIVEKLENTVLEQTGIYYYMVIEKLGLRNESFDKAKNHYREHKMDIYRNVDTELISYCSSELNLDRPENLPRENFLDVIVVLDTSSSEDGFRKQQIITGLLAKNLDLRYTGSRMTILLDHRINTETSTSARVELKPVVEDTYSSSCAACTVGQISYERSQVDEEQIIHAIDQLLQEKKENETAYNGVNGKVVVYFNFDEDDMNRRGNSKIQAGLNKALSNLHLHHPDVMMYAVGLNDALLKRFAKNDKASVVSAGKPAEEVAKKLYERIVNVPGQLKYPDCRETRSESFATYENFVSPNAVQHWSFPPEYFYKSINLKVTFESRNGVIRVCHNRATMKPEEEIKNCNTTISGNRVEFKLPNPCKGFDEISCSPFYFAVMGKPADANGNSRNTYCEDTKEHWCRTLEQIKFTVSHEGMRCSGCIGLHSFPAIVLFTILLSYILHKNV